MCGIAGVLGPRDDVDLEAMTGRLVRRGPDDAGEYCDRELAVGFRRLAIIDVEGGRQPLLNERRDCVLVCNGEIYNHRELRRELLARGHHFVTRSDAEVILHLYEEVGMGCLQRIRGMYAFALWDRSRQRLFLARDHVGMKPLYYNWNGRRLVFASQVGALLAGGGVARRPNLRAIQGLFYYQAIPPPDTIVEGCHAVPAGHYLEAAAGRAPEHHRYWRLRYDRRRAPGRADDAVDWLREGVSEAVRSHLQTEVPLGSFLSGGLDSSVIVGLLAGQTPGRLKTFSVGFEGAGTGSYSELPYARMVARHFDTDHHEVVHSGRSVARELPAMIEAMDQPTTDGINSYLVSQLAARDVTVAFSGTGPDELFLGYGRDAWHHRLRHAYAAQELVPRRLRELAAGILARLPRAAITASLARSMHLVSGDARAMLRAFLFEPPYGLAVLPPFRCRQLIGHSPESRAGATIETDPLAPPFGADEPLAIALSRWEVEGFAGFVLLPDIDAMSMFHSLEVRVPFYDRSFAETAFALPARLKDPRRGTKWLLKRAFGHLLPPAILDRPKQGFSLPLHLWLDRELKSSLDSALDPTAVADRGLFDPAVITAYRRRFAAGESDCWQVLWAATVIEGWCRRHLDGRPRAELFDPPARARVESLSA